MNKQELLFNVIASVSAEFHSSLTHKGQERLRALYDRQKDKVSGFTGLWDYCEQAGHALHSQTEQLEVGEDFDFIDTVTNFVALIYFHEERQGSLPNDIELKHLAIHATE